MRLIVEHEIRKALFSRSLVRTHDKSLAKNAALRTIKSFLSSHRGKKSEEVSRDCIREKYLWKRGKVSKGLGK